MSPRFRRAFGNLAVIAVAVTVAILCAPAPAHGECGDYIVYTNPAQGKPMADHGRLPVKCTGPNCSQSPAPAPMPQAPPSLRILPDQSLPLTRGEAESTPDSQFFALDAADGLPVRRASDIFHPPR